MNTPVWNFVNSYAGSDILRLHMPGHKGLGKLGCELYDITEIAGADSLYEASGIIAQSEANASSLYGSGRTIFSTEGSSQCIRAMVHLAVTCRAHNAAPVILAARNAHRSFVHAAALADADIVWMMPENGPSSLMSCPISPGSLRETLLNLKHPCCGVYVTSPDYLGNCQDISALSTVCKESGVPLMVDNAHGAYLHFLPDPAHPLDLGADICCDSAHKFLPVLTGGAYLHISKNAPGSFREHAKSALALHGSTSPSYLIMASLDLCNKYISDGLVKELPAAVKAISVCRHSLAENGWHTAKSDPLRITIYGDGAAIGKRLRSHNTEPEYAGQEAAVLLFSAASAPAAAPQVVRALGINNIPDNTCPPSLNCIPKKVMSIRQAVFSQSETIPSGLSAGRIAAAPTASCPPAVPVVMPGELIDGQAVEMLRFYGYDKVCVVKE